MVIKKKIEDIIDKAGSVVDSQEDDEFIAITLRIKRGMLKQVDECVKNSVGIYRNGWILQAINKQLEHQKVDR